MDYSFKVPLQPHSSNLSEVLNALRQEFLRQGGDFESTSNVLHNNAEAAHRDALLHASAPLLQRLKLEKGLELRQQDLRVAHRAVIHWRKVSDHRKQAYQWRQTSIGTLPATPTFLGYVYWLPKLPTSDGDGGGLGNNETQLNLMRQLVRRR